MSDSKEDTPDLPDEVKRVLANLKPEPDAADAVREQLLAELDAAMGQASGPLRLVLEGMQRVLQSTRPGAPFQPHFAREFSAAFDRYRKDPAGAQPPPGVLLDCFIFLRELVQVRGLGGLLEAVDEVSPQATPPQAEDRHSKELQARINLSNTRG